MAAQAQTKLSQFHKSLWTHIFQGTKIEQAEIDEIEKDIKILDQAQRAYLDALLFAAKQDYDSAVQMFNQALELAPSSVMFAQNYLMYVGISARNHFHRMEVLRLEKHYSFPEMRRSARNLAYCVANTKLVKKFNLKLAALEGEEEKSSILKEGERMCSIIDNFKNKSKLTSNEIEELCDEAEAIANKFGVNCIGVDYFVSNEDDSAYIIRAETSDSAKLSEINMELIELLSTDKYINKPFTSWFRSDSTHKDKRYGS